MTWKLLYKHLLQYQAQLFDSGDPSGELQHLEKLMSSIQQTLQESDSEITPRQTSAKLSIGNIIFNIRYGNYASVSSHSCYVHWQSCR